MGLGFLLNVSSFIPTPTPLSSPQFMFLTYILALAFLAIFGFTAIPVFLFFNMWNTCAAMKSPDANITSPDSICVDVRQYGRSEDSDDNFSELSSQTFSSPRWLDPPRFACLTFWWDYVKTMTFFFWTLVKLFFKIGCQNLITEEQNTNILVQHVHIPQVFWLGVEVKRIRLHAVVHVFKDK